MIFWFVWERVHQGTVHQGLKMTRRATIMLQFLRFAAAAAAAAAAAVAGGGPSGNYSVVLRHGSQADCPCFRIPCLVTTADTASASSLVLLVEARWSSSECYPIVGAPGKKPPHLPPSPPALALVSSTDAVRLISRPPVLSLLCCCSCRCPDLTGCL